MLTTEAMHWFVAQYLNSPADAENPYVSPMHAKDHAGLPPAIVVTAEFDPLRDDGEAYAERLRAAGVSVSVRRYEGMVHGWYWMGAYVDAAHELIGDLGRNLKEILAR